MLKHPFLADLSTHPPGCGSVRLALVAAEEVLRRTGAVTGFSLLNTVLSTLPVPVPVGWALAIRITTGTLVLMTPAFALLGGADTGVSTSPEGTGLIVWYAL